MKKGINRRLYKHEIEKAYNKAKKRNFSDLYTLLDFITDEDQNIYVCERWTKTQKSKTFLNRINLCWVYPLFILAMPIRFLACGDAGFKRDTKLYKIVGKLLGGYF